MAIAALIAYIVTASIALYLLHRFVRPLTTIAAVALTLLPLVFTGRAIFTGQVMAPIDLPYQADPLKSIAAEHGITRFHNAALSDLYCQIIPWRKAVRHAYSLREWPLWNPFAFAGDILAASAQPAPYHPVNLISYLLPFDVSLTFIAAITFFIAGVSAFLLARELGCSDLPSLVAGAIWMYSNVVAFWLEWPIGLSTAFIPLVLAAVRRVVGKPGFASGMLLLVSLVLIVLAGHPETAFHTVAVGTVFGLALMTRNRRLTGRIVATALIAGVVAFGIVAVYTLPILEALPQTFEHKFRARNLASIGHSVPMSDAMRRIPPNILPFVYGSAVGEQAASVEPEWGFAGNGYAGSLALALALFGVIASRRRMRWLFAAFAVIAIVLGTNMPGPTDLLGMLPLFDVALNNRLIFLLPLSIAILAAFGCQAFQRSGRNILVLTLCAAAAGALLLVGAEWDAMRERGLSAGFIATQAIPFVLPLALAAIAARVVRDRAAVIALLAVAIVAQRYFEPAGSFYPTLPRGAFYPPIPGFEKLAPGAAPYRIVGQFYTLIPGTSALYELEDVRAYQAMTNARFMETFALWAIVQPVWYNRVEYLGSPFLKALNVRYAIATPTDPAVEGWTLIDERRGLRIFENEHFIERAFIPRTVVIDEPDPIRRMLMEEDFTARSWVTVNADSTSGVERPNGEGSLHVTREGLGLRLRARITKTAWVIISQTAWDGWRAISNGKELPLARGNHALLALELPEGEHDVKLVYRPVSFVLGRAISAVSILLVIAACWYRAKRGARSRAQVVTPMSHSA